MDTWDVSNPPMLQRRYQGAQVPAHAGAFDYSGFGYGTLYLPEGERLWGTRSEAVAECAKLGITMAFYDRLDGYTGVYLGD